MTFRLNTFPMKLFRILNDSRYAKVIHWQSHGRSFMVPNPKRFVRDVARVHFDLKKWSSFQRQLNIYGFHKVRGGYDADAFFHPFFSKDAPENILNITRVPVKGTKRGACSFEDYYDIINTGHRSHLEPKEWILSDSEDDSITNNSQLSVPSTSTPSLDFKVEGDRFHWIISSPRPSYYSSSKLGKEDLCSHDCSDSCSENSCLQSDSLPSVITLQDSVELAKDALLFSAIDFWLASEAALQANLIGSNDDDGSFDRKDDLSYSALSDVSYHPLRNIGCSDTNLSNSLFPETVMNEVDDELLELLHYITDNDSTPSSHYLYPFH